MFSKQNDDHLKENYHYRKELFINGRQGQLMIEPLNVFKPQNANEWRDIYQYCKLMNIKFKLIKGNKCQFINPGYNDDSLVIDVDDLDTIIDFKNGTINHLPGTTASQLNHYLEGVNPGCQVPLSIELTNPLLMYNQPCPNYKDNNSFEYGLMEHQIDNRLLILGFNSTEALYNLHHDIMLLKAELGSLALSFFYVNQDAILANQHYLKKNKILNSNNILEVRALKKHPWFLLIELPYNKHLVSSIIAMINERLGGAIYWGDSFLRRIKMPFNKGLSSDVLMQENNNMSYCETLNLTVQNDINLLLFAYHAVYRENLSSNIKPQIFIDMSSNEKIKLSVKIYYSLIEKKQEVLDYALNIINRIKLKC